MATNDPVSVRKIALALDALYSSLNVEGAAKAGATGAFDGLDVKYHFDKIRKAIRFIETGKDSELARHDEIHSIWSAS